MAQPDPFSPQIAGMDLGMGDALQNQVSAEILARRKKMLLSATQQPAAFGMLGLGITPAPGSGNSGGAAWQTLMGQGVNG